MRTVPDSSILIPVLREEAYQAEIRQSIARKRMWLSDVVVAELMAGARTQHERRRYVRFFAPLRQHGNVLTPTPQEWDTCGRLLSRYRQQYGDIKPRDHQNDVLILLSAVRSAHDEETVLLTENDADFAMWLGMLRNTAGLRIQPRRRGV